MTEALNIAQICPVTAETTLAPSECACEGACPVAARLMLEQLGLKPEDGEI